MLLLNIVVTVNYKMSYKVFFLNLHVHAAN